MAQRPSEVPTVTSYSGSRVDERKGWWWEATENDLAHTLWQQAKAVEDDQRDREDTALIHLCLYHNQRVSSLYAAGFAHGTGGWKTATGIIGHRSTYNVIASVGDAATNRIAKNNAAVTYLTNGGQWSLRKKSKNLKKFTDGMFRKLEMYELMRDAFEDTASAFDTGVIKYWTEGENIRAARTIPTELFVDEADAIYGKPKTLYHRMFVNRSVLKRQYPKYAQQIESANSVSPVPDAGKRTRDDLVEVWEAWHLPTSSWRRETGKDGKPGKWTETIAPGRRVMALQHQVLVDEQYRRPFFPFTFWRWKRRRVGFWGQCLAEINVGIQLEINELSKRIQQGHRRVANPRVFMEYGGEVGIDQLDSTVGAPVYHARGSKPTFETPTAFNRETYEYREQLKRDAHEQAGISEMFAAAKRPEGVDAAVALRELRDIGSERHVTVGQAYEKFAVDNAKMIINLAREMYADGVDIQAQPATKDFLESVKWSDVDLDDSQFEVVPFPTSSLPDHPAGRLQTITELYKAGLIFDRDTAVKLLDFPDLEEELSLRLAVVDEIGRVLENIEDHGKYEAPDPAIDPQQAIELAHASFVRGLSGGLPDDRLDMLLRYQEEAQAILDSVPQSAPAPPAAGPQAPALPSGAPIPGMAQPPAPALPAAVPGAPTPAPPV